VLQRQFHCGNPPPAAEPRIRARMLHPRGVVDVVRQL
jgi:hypothetical protein